MQRQVQAISYARSSARGALITIPDLAAAHAAVDGMDAVVRASWEATIVQHREVLITNQDVAEESLPTLLHDCPSIEIASFKLLESRGPHP